MPSAKNIAFFVICWGFSFVFLLLFFKNTDFSGMTNLNPLSYLILLLGLSLALLPFAKRINIAKLLELEMDIKQTKTEMKDFKREVAQFLSIISTNINTISNTSNNTVNITIPGLDKLLKEKEKLNKTTDRETLRDAEKIKNDLMPDSEDNIMSLARTRIRLESALKKILSRDNHVGEFDRYLPMGRMINMFLKRYPNYAELGKSFKYVVSICNAAIHAQRVTDEQAEEALDMGAKLIAILDKILAVNSHDGVEIQS